MSDKANSRLYGYRTMSKQSFNTNFSSLGLSMIRVCAFLHVYCLMLSAFLKMLSIPKDFINIHENKNQMTYNLGWHNIALTTI